MIVCVCSNVSDGKIRQAITGGVTRMSELRDQLDVGTCCGKCNSCAKRILNECLATSQPNAPQPIMFQISAMAA